MSEYIRLQANGADAYPDASTENTYRPNGTSVESALVNLESNVNTLGGVAGEAKTLAEQNSVKIATAEQEISDINSSLEGKILPRLILLSSGKSVTIPTNDHVNFIFCKYGFGNGSLIGSIDKEGREYYTVSGAENTGITITPNRDLTYTIKNTLAWSVDFIIL